MHRQNQEAHRIEDYGIIGDCRAAVLVSKNGSMDWLCWPRFDSPAVFAAILDPERGGRWTISPSMPFTTERRYIENTNVLVTRFKTETGAVTLTDVMPVAAKEDKANALWPDHEIVREVRCEHGDVAVEVELQPRQGYGHAKLKIRDAGALGLRMDDGRGAYWLRSTVPLSIGEGDEHATVRVKQGEVIQFSLSYAEESPTVLPLLGQALTTRIAKSVRWWQQWAEQCSYEGPYKREVVRSALALKLLTYAPSGAIAAAATTSLPELVGGSLNWDYRYCWLRDASLTIRVLLGLGYIAEAESFLTWLLHATRMTQPQLRVLYSVYGEIAPHERELKFLSGYRNSRPVRVGNGARGQLQLDIYGEVVDAAAQYVRSGRTLDRTTQKVLTGFGEYVAKNWNQPDEGIWEPRSGRGNHTHSRLMCWTALDRLLELSQRGSITGAPCERFERERENIRRQIYERAWSVRLQSYVSTPDGDTLDATLLRIPWYGFEKPDAERAKLTYQRVLDMLGAGSGGLLYRYLRHPAEGAFGICGFWAAEYLAIGGGSVDDAHRYFEKLLEYQNDLGLFSEEIDPDTGEALGNFPQAFTHLGLISAALSLRERERGEPHPAQHRKETGAPVVGGAKL